MARELSKREYPFFKQWYFPPIWTYISTNPYISDAKQISIGLKNKVSVNDVKKALTIMLELNLITKMANGYKVTGEHIGTPDELMDITLMEYNQQFLDQAKEHLDETQAALRQYNTMVISCSKEGFDALKQATQKFQNEVRAIAAQDKNETEVYALGMQLFPYANKWDTYVF